ncbi:MAG: CYTH domain-containing protein [Chloroflexota bacterium]
MAELEMEVELKYAATQAALDTLGVARELGPAELGETLVNDETDRYLDTVDRRLHAAAWACRLRTRRVAGEARTFVSLKGPAAAVAGALHRRPELEGPATDDLDPVHWPPSAARDLVDRLRDGGGLVEFLRLTQRRLERAVTIDGARIGTLSLDDVVAHRGSQELGMLRAAELELGAGDGEAWLPELAAALERVEGLATDHRSKLEHALAFAAAQPAVGT